MTYDQFKQWVREKGYTVPQLRADDAPPTPEMDELMARIGLAKYERFVLRLQKEVGR